MLLEKLEIAPDEFQRRTGWEIRPEGACKGDLCVPLPDSGNGLDAQMLSDRLGMALVHDAEHGLWALGPASGLGRALLSAELPDITLPDRNGEDFSLRSLRGTKIFMLAWASW